MRLCGLCQRIPRRDDPLDFLHQIRLDVIAPGEFYDISPAIPSIMALACRDCHGKPHPRWEWGCKMPLEGDGSVLRVCGLCRLALYEDDAGGKCIRVTAEDLAVAGVVLPDGYRPGAYPVCRECYNLFRPIIHARLVVNPPYDGMGTGKQTVPPLGAFHGDWCM